MLFFFWGMGENGSHAKDNPPCRRYSLRDCRCLNPQGWDTVQLAHDAHNVLVNDFRHDDGAQTSNNALYPQRPFVAKPLMSKPSLRHPVPEYPRTVGREAFRICPVLRGQERFTVVP